MPATSALLRRLTLATLVVWGASVQAAGDDQAEKAVALLDSRCFKCHSHSAGKNKGGLVMDSLAGLTTGGDEHPLLGSRSHDATERRASDERRSHSPPELG